MIDVGLLLTVLIMLGGVQLALRIFPPTAADRSAVVQLVSTPLFVGFIASRVVFVLVDHPASVFRVRDLMVFRAGVEFWAGVVVALSLVLFRVRQSADRVGAMVAFAAATPFLLFSVALFEGSCIVRDGCLGPVSSVGLKPSGLDTTMLPIGIIVALALLASALVLRQAWTLKPEQTVMAALVIISAVRLVASQFLPAFGPSRAEKESAVVLVISLTTAVAFAARRRRCRPVTLASNSTSAAEAVDNAGGDVAVS